MISREVQLVRRPSGAPVPEDFTLASRKVPGLGDCSRLPPQAWLGMGANELDGLDAQDVIAQRAAP